MIKRKGVIRSFSVPREARCCWYAPKIANRLRGIVLDYGKTFYGTDFIIAKNPQKQKKQTGLTG